jgi:oligopeptidase B
VEAGWAIGYTFLRGGGDHTETWAKAGRLEGRVHTVDDFIALVKFAQAYLQIPPSHTVLYGRSAGGLLMGESLRRYPNGSLMKAVYAEVPYVDELRTTSNPELPLTTLETNEFGNSMLRLKDFIDIGLLSPVDSASVLHAPNVLVLARSAIHDSQVFTYESVKWIRRLRANQTEKGAPKLCIIEKDQGHFTPPDATIKQWSLDAAILDAWIQKEIQ